MKKTILFLLIALLSISVTSFGQSNKKKVEVLYFKADLACCRARACNALQADVDSVLKRNFAKENIEFKVIRLADVANKDLVAKYNAKAQTVVIVKTKRKKETATDVSSIVQDYAMSHNQEKFENELKARIKESLK